MKRVDKFKSGERYRFVKDWEQSVWPLRWYAKKGDIIIFNCRGFGSTGRFYAEKDKRLIIIPAKEAFKIIEELGEHRGRRRKLKELKVQDAGSYYQIGQVAVYHTHGTRQWYGLCKIHKALHCPILENWKPGKNLGKVIMREWINKYQEIDKQSRCKICWRDKEGRDES